MNKVYFLLIFTIFALLSKIAYAQEIVDLELTQQKICHQQYVFDKDGSPEDLYEASYIEILSKFSIKNGDNCCGNGWICNNTKGCYKLDGEYCKTNEMCNSQKCIGNKCTSKTEISKFTTSNHKKQTTTKKNEHRLKKPKNSFVAVILGFSEWLWKGDINFGIPTINSTLSLKIKCLLIGVGIEHLILPEFSSIFAQIGFFEGGLSLSAEIGYYSELEKMKSSLTISYNWIFEPFIISTNISAIYLNDFLLSFGAKIGFCFGFDGSKL